VSYLLDTTVLADFANGSHGARELVEELFAETGDLYTCEVVSCEALSGGGEIERTAVRKLLDALEFVALDPGGARYAGELRRAAGRTSGRTLGDALMAALAWRIAATIVTRNGRDFVPYGVKVREYGASAS
jgi:predicted nucleic acid-binding protein